MKEIRRRKVLALVMTISLILGMGFNSNPNIAAASGAAPVDDSISSFAVTEVTGSAITFYIGGENALDTNNGTSSATPFATLAQAAEATREADREVVHDSEGYEVYQFIVQGDTTETKEIKIGDWTTKVKVKATILGNAATGSAIVHRNPSFTFGSLIYVSSNACLTLGDASATSDSNLIFDDGNFTVVDSIIANHSDLILNNGVTLQNHMGIGYDHAGSVIYNCGNFDMYGGSIQGNTSATDGGGVHNSETFHMHGGSITNNTSSKNGGGICNYGTFVMTGGIIDSNSASKGSAIYQGGGSVMISGDATIPAGESKDHDIYLEKSAITIETDLSTLETIMITLPSYYEGAPILYGAQELIANNCNKFALSDTSGKYIINSGGYVSYVGVEGTYYVDEAKGSDANSGSVGSPFSTLKKAVSEIELINGKGTIILQSDILLKETLLINGDIKIISDGTAHEIKRDVSALPESFTGHQLNAWTLTKSMFVVFGSLILGEESNNGDDNNPALTINGGGVDADLGYFSELINNIRALTIYSGVMVTGGSGGAVTNDGTFIMEGGKICNNKMYSAVVYNYGIFTMNGGSITNNIANGVYNMCDFNMSGDAIISYNTGKSGGGVYNNKNFTMSGGIIEHNLVAASGYGKGILNGYSATLTMSGDARVGSSDYIYMRVSKILDDTYENSKLIINGPFTGSDTIAHIITYQFSGSTDTYSDYIMPGAKILTSGTDYTFTSEDASRFPMVAAGYCINQQGIIAKMLPEGATALTVGNIYYDGTEKSVAGITVKDGSTTLVENVDYTVSYENNINAGNNASVIITGIHNYAGIQKANFTIKPAKLISIQTAAPTNQFFMASDAKTVDDLLATIHLSEAEVAYEVGTGLLPVQWSFNNKEEFDPKGGSYTLSGMLQSSVNVVNPDGIHLETKITITPSTPINPIFSNIKVKEGTDASATAAELGNEVLPTNGTVSLVGTAVNYTIQWGDENLDTTDASASTMFTGIITYTNPPIWATLPDSLIVTRIVGVTAPDPTVPGAPTIGIATAGDAQAKVIFTAPSYTGGSNITGYTVTATPTTGGIPITATGTASPIIVTGLTNGTAYTFTVAATNSLGTGVISAASESITPNAITETNVSPTPSTIPPTTPTTSTSPTQPTPTPTPISDNIVIKVDEDVIDTLGKIIIPSEGIAEKLNSQELEHVNISVQLPDKI